MDAEGLRNGFRVGDWLIEPRESRASKSDQTVSLTDDQIEVLIVLASRHGEAVDHRTLRNEIWPGCHGAEEKLRHTVGELRELFGDKPRHPRYIASVGNDSYALIAHFEQVAPVARAPDLLASGYAAPVHIRRPRAAPARGTQTPERLQGHGLLPGRHVDHAAGRPSHVRAAAVPGLVDDGIDDPGGDRPADRRWYWRGPTRSRRKASCSTPGVDGTGVMRRLPRPRQSIAPVIVAGVALMATVTGFAWWRSLDVPATAAASSRPPAGTRAPLDRRAAAGRHERGGRQCLPRRRTERGTLDASSRRSGAARGGAHVRLRVQGQEPRRPQDRPVAGRAARARGQRASQWRRRSRDGAADRHCDGLSRLGRQFRSRVARRPGTAGRHRHLGDGCAAGRPQGHGPAAQRGQGRIRSTRAPSIRTWPVSPPCASRAISAGCKQAETSFKAAIDIDPEFAGAYAGLCRTYARQFERTRDPAPLAAAEGSAGRPSNWILAGRDREGAREHGRRRRAGSNRLRRPIAA